MVKSLKTLREEKAKREAKQIVKPKASQNKTTKHIMMKKEDYIKMYNLMNNNYEKINKEIEEIENMIDTQQAPYDKLLIYPNMVKLQQQLKITMQKVKKFIDKF